MFVLQVEIIETANRFLRIVKTSLKLKANEAFSFNKKEDNKKDKEDIVTLSDQETNLSINCTLLRSLEQNGHSRFASLFG